MTISVAIEIVQLGLTATAGWLADADAGALIVVGGIAGTTGAGDTGTLHVLADPLTGPPVAAFWLWLLATSIVLFRRASADGVE